ncbi:MAG: rhomboid family intramembrane serine protease [Clostridia bacterium]|nr:rhomboid family intramembrane serine protease [Clostridia bacterium]
MQKFLNRMEWKINRFAVRDLMKYVCIAMLGVFVLDYLPMLRSASQLLYFNRDLIMRGQVWRLVTFIALPPTGSFIWILFSLYFYYFIGSSLEGRWGSARFMLYYVIGVLCNIIAGFITGYATNEYLNLSLLLCFAALYPDHQFMVMFFLPIKAKWIGIADAVLLVIMFLQSGWAGRIGMAFSLLPFFLFLGKDVYLQGKMAFKRLQYRINTRR